MGTTVIFLYESCIFFIFNLNLSVNVQLTSWNLNYNSLMAFRNTLRLLGKFVSFSLDKVNFPPFIFAQDMHCRSFEKGLPKNSQYMVMLQAHAIVTLWIHHFSYIICFEHDHMIYSFPKAKSKHNFQKNKCKSLSLSLSRTIFLLNEYWIS
jgi:hypothetical protein